MVNSKQYQQPKGLYLLFFTELWERFGFYTVQTIIVLYMTKALHFSDQRADLLYAAFSSLLYITPVIGGYIADRYLGFQRSIQLGGIIFVIGYFCTAFAQPTIFFVGLSIVIIANGLFKPNVSSIVGELYQENDPRRDGGFTLFYMGINIGALIPPLFAGWAVTHYGWHSGFFLAAVGMLIGLIYFTRAKKILGSAGAAPKSHFQTAKDKKFFNIWFYPMLGIGVVLCYLAFQFPAMTTNLVGIVALILILVIVRFLFKEPEQKSRQKMLASLILIAISVVFWALYNQTFTSLTLFADRNMVHHFLGIPVDAEAMQFFNPFFIILLSPFLSRFWIWLSMRNKNISIPSKFALGVLMVSLGFLLLAFSTGYFNHNGLNAPSWLVWSYFLQTIGELLLSPIGLSMITVLCPPQIVSMMMGAFLFAQAASFAIGGHLAIWAAVPDHATTLQSMAIYHHAFVLYGFLSLIFAVLCFFMVPFLNRMIAAEPRPELTVKTA